MIKAIVTIFCGNGTGYSEHVRYFEAETIEILRKNASDFRDGNFKGWSFHVVEVGTDLDSVYGSEYVSSYNL